MKGTLKIPGTFQGTFTLDSVIQGSKTTCARIDNRSAFIGKGKQIVND